MRRFAPLVVLVALVGCGSTETRTIARPPNLGAPTGEAHDPTAGATLRSYKPKHGNAERATFYNASGCGVERWAVKTLTDPAANQVNLTPQLSSIADLVSITPPVSPTDRVGPTETSTFQISGTLTFIKQEADGDYHLVLSDGQNTMIVESPNPSCAQGSVVLKQIEEVRQALDAKGGVSEPTPVPMTVTGVGFFDRLHGQTGVAPNGIELHPLLSVRF